MWNFLVLLKFVIWFVRILKYIVSKWAALLTVYLVLSFLFDYQTARWRDLIVVPGAVMYAQQRYFHSEKEREKKHISSLTLESKHSIIMVHAAWLINVGTHRTNSYAELYIHLSILYLCKMVVSLWINVLFLRFEE